MGVNGIYLGFGCLVGQEQSDSCRDVLNVHFVIHLYKQVYLTSGTSIRSWGSPEFPSRSLEMDDRENPLEREHCLSVVLPGGLEKNATVHGR